MTKFFPCLRAQARRLVESSSLAWPRYARKESAVQKEEAQRLIELAQAGAPVHGDALLVALAATGDAAQPAWQDQQDAEELVQTLRKEGLI